MEIVLNNETLLDNVTFPPRYYRCVVIILYSGILPPLVVFGLSFSIMALIILFRNVSGNHNVYQLLGLCVADMFNMMTIGAYSIAANISLYKDVNFDMAFKWVYSACHNAFFFCMVYTTLLIAIERVVAINKPLTVHIIWKKSTTLKALATVYGLGIIVGTADVVKNYIARTGNERLNTDWIRIYDIFILIVMSFLPVGVLVVCNVVIIRDIARHEAVKLVEISGTQNGINSQPRRLCLAGNCRRLTKTLLLVTMMLTLCATPGAILRAICWSRRETMGMMISQPKSITELIYMIIVFVEYVHCCINAFMYIVGNRKFRFDLKNLLRQTFIGKICTRQRRQPVRQMTSYSLVRLSTRGV